MTAEINLTPTGLPFEIEKAGRIITGKTWGNSQLSRAGIVLVHGLGAHSGWFEALARRLKVKQLFVLAYDQAGFGQNRKHKLSTYKQWLDDLTLAYRYLQEQIGDKPAYILGNSMGASVALCAAPALAPCGLILVSPGFAGQRQTFTEYFQLKAILLAIFSPDTEVKLPYSASAFIRDRDLCTWVDNDPQARFSVPAWMLLQLLQLTRQAGRVSITCPALVLTAGMDKVVDNKATVEAFKKLASPLKRHRHLAEAFHDLMFDPAIDELTAEIVDWTSANALPVQA